MAETKTVNQLGAVLDDLKVNKALSEAVELAKNNPAQGLAAAIGTSVVMQTFLDQLSSEKNLRNNRLSISLSSLDALRKPVEEVSSQATKESYASTLSSLASVADLSKSLKFSTMPTLETNLFKRCQENEAIKWGGLNNDLAIDRFKKSISSYDSTAKLLKLGTYHSELQRLTSNIDQINRAADQLNIRLGETSSIASTYLSSVTSLYFTESKLDSLKNNFSPFGSKSLVNQTAAISIGNIEKLHHSLSEMSLASSQAWLKISSSPKLIGSTSPELLKLPAIELYTSSNLANAVSFDSGGTLDRDNEIDGLIQFQSDSLDKKLMALDPDLFEIYRGGVAVILSGAPDWQRHAMTSFRELLMHVMQKLSPDPEVVAAGGELHDGRPTRRARLKFIFSGVVGGEFNDFFEADIKAALELFDLLSKGTHKIKSKANSVEVFYLKGRISGLIYSMLSARGY